MTLWELAAAIEGYNRANGAEDKPAPPSDEEFEALKAAHADL